MKGSGLIQRERRTCRSKAPGYPTFPCTSRWNRPLGPKAGIPWARASSIHQFVPTRYWLVLFCSEHGIPLYGWLGKNRAHGAIRRHIHE